MRIQAAKSALIIALSALAGCTTPEAHPVPPGALLSSASDGTIVEMPDSQAPAAGSAPSGVAVNTPAPAPAESTAPATSQTASASPPTTGGATETAPQAAVASIRFTPVIGAPVEIVRPLSHQLAIAARARGIVIRASSDVASDNILRGYFSASSDGRQTTVVYVWDILDNSGDRMDRIQGQEMVARAPKGDPWTAVPASTMQTIADKTIAGYLAFRAAHGR